MQLAGPTNAPTTVRDGEIVEDEQLARRQTNLSLNVFDAQGVALEETHLRAETVELHPTQKPRVGLDTRKRRYPGGRFHHAGQASLDVASCVIPGAVRLAVSDQPREQGGA